MLGPKISVVIPNWNGKESIADCLDSLIAQSKTAQVIVVDNGSTDGSVTLIEEKYPGTVLIKHKKNLGFAGGVNAGIRYAIKSGSQYVALLNNDAVADSKWLKILVNTVSSNSKIGIATGKMIDSKNKFLDSTGEMYTSWGLPFPRGRGEAASNQYDDERWVFGASGGASLYRVKMLEEIGLFDNDFFAYYEDVDISFRAQLAGWKIAYAPSAVAYHEIGATSSKINGFTTYQTIKNLPQLYIKNMPGRLFWSSLLRFKLAYWSFVASAVARGQGWPAIKGLVVAFTLMPKKLFQRYKIQKNRKVSVEYISSILVHDLPPNAHKLRKLRSSWWKLTRRPV